MEACRLRQEEVPVPDGHPRPRGCGRAIAFGAAVVIGVVLLKVALKLPSAPVPHAVPTTAGAPAGGDVIHGDGHGHYPDYLTNRTPGGEKPWQ